PGAFEHHGIACMAVIMRAAEMGGMHLISSRHAPGFLGSPIGQAVSLLTPLVHWIWSGISPMARVGSMVAALKAGVQAPATMDAISSCLSMKASPVYRGSLAQIRTR